ncbi:MAG TPA: SCP2 sterol-binding domain-containing protein [Acidimicrobiales bacterium]|nr:SCP2 sterol-binding domain-containing protein [Acidimicrobiales bacterium]
MPHWDISLGNDPRAAVATMARRSADLVRSVADASAPTLGVWDAGQLAAHITHVFEVDADLINEVPSPLADLDDLGELTQSKVRDEAVHDLGALAARIESAAETFLAVAAKVDGHAPRDWLGGARVTASVLACHIVSECLVHGRDLSKATGQRWPLERTDAVLAFRGFICPMYRALGRPTYAVHPERAAGLRATYDIRIRGGGRVFFVFADGGLTIEDPSNRKVDCHLSIDPRALVLLAWHRTGLAPPLLRGQISTWGRRPWLAPRLPGLIRPP